MEVSSIDGLHHGVLNAVIENINAIRLIGKDLRERACKIGATKHFWEVYERRIGQGPNAQFPKRAQSQYRTTVTQTFSIHENELILRHGRF